MTCNKCLVFNGFYRCNKPEECDCPKCQGLCTCDFEDSDEALSIDQPFNPLDEVPEGCGPDDKEE